MLTEPNLVKEAENYHLMIDAESCRQANEYAEAVTASIASLSFFKDFLWDIDTESPELQAIHGCRDESPEDQLFAYALLMKMFEEYCHEVHNA